MSYIDTVDVRPCRWCGVELLRTYDTEGVWLVDLEPGAVWDGSTVEFGWRFVREVPLTPRWVVHLGRVSPDVHCVFRPHDCVPVAPPTPTRGDKHVSDHDDDPFDKPDSRPSVSFKGAPIGATITCIIDGAPNKMQARDFDTRELETWDDGNPVYTVATDVVVNGTPMTLWAKIPSSMYTAIAEAQKAADAKLAKGGTLVVRFVGEKPNEKKPHLNPQKLYQAHYTPPAAADPFDAGQQAPQQSTPAPQETPAQPAGAGSAPPWATS